LKKQELIKIFKGRPGAQQAPKTQFKKEDNIGNKRDDEYEDYVRYVGN
jgi:hypothetical protein